MGEMAAILEAEDRTHEHADGPGDAEAISPEVGLVKAGRRREV